MQAPKWGSRPALGASPERRGQPRCSRLASPLCPLFLYCGGSGSDVFCFRLLGGIIIIFFLAPFLYFLGPGEAATTDHRLVSAPAPGGGSFSSLRSSRLAPFSSVAARSSILPGLPAAGWLSPLPAASALRLSLPHPAAPSSPVLSAVPAPS